MRTEIGELVLIAARSVLAEKEAGRSVDPLRLRWAQQMVAGNRSPEQMEADALADAQRRREREAA